MTIQCIVVGVDGSDGAARALTWATDLAGALGAEVAAVHAQPPLGYPAASGFGFPLPMVPQQELDAWREAEHKLVAEWCSPLRATKTTHRSLIVVGEPAAVIMDTADHEKADLIVAGRRGRGGFAELILGSVGHHLTHHSRIPVAIIPGESNQHDSPD